MNIEDRDFVATSKDKLIDNEPFGVLRESLNCYENDPDVLRDNILKLSGMLGLQIRLLQNIQEEKEHEENVRHMTPVEQNIARLLNSFEQSISVKLAKSQDISDIKESLSSLKNEVIEQIKTHT